LKGAGDIFAVGGSGETTNAGGGGGGRISVHCINSTFTGAYAAYGGWANAGHPGSAGSIYNNCGKFKGYLMSSLPTELGGVLVLNGVKLDIKVDTDASTDQVVATTRTIDVAESGYLNLRGVDPTLPIHDGRPFDKLVSSPSNVIYLSEGTTNSLSAATIVGSNPDSSTDTSEYTFDIKRLYVDRGSTVVLPKIVQLINFTLTVKGSVLGLSNFTVKRSTVDFSNMFNIDAAHPDIAPQDLNLNTFTVVGSLFTLPSGGRIYVTHDFTIESFPLSLFDPTQKLDSVVSYSRNITLHVGGTFHINTDNTFDGSGGGGYVSTIERGDVSTSVADAWQSLGGSFGGQGGDYFDVASKLPEGWVSGSKGMNDRQSVGGGGGWSWGMNAAGAARCLQACRDTIALGPTGGSNFALGVNGEPGCVYEHAGCFTVDPTYPVATQHSQYQSNMARHWNHPDVSNVAIHWKGLVNAAQDPSTAIRSFGNLRWPTQMGRSGWIATGGETIVGGNAGAAGAAIQVHARHVVVDGTIDVSGNHAGGTALQQPTTIMRLAGGGGSGGSILIVAEALVGHGKLVANFVLYIFSRYKCDAFFVCSKPSLGMSLSFSLLSVSFTILFLFSFSSCRSLACFFLRWRYFLRMVLY